MNPGAVLLERALRCTGDIPKPRCNWVQNIALLIDGKGKEKETPGLCLSLFFPLPSLSFHLNFFFPLPCFPYWLNLIASLVGRAFKKLKKDRGPGVFVLLLPTGISRRRRRSIIQFGKHLTTRQQTSRSNGFGWVFSMLIDRISRRNDATKYHLDTMDDGAIYCLLGRESENYSLLFSTGRIDMG